MPSHDRSSFRKKGSKVTYFVKMGYVQKETVNCCFRKKGSKANHFVKMGFEITLASPSFPETVIDI